MDPRGAVLRAVGAREAGGSPVPAAVCTTEPGVRTAAPGPTSARLPELPDFPEGFGGRARGGGWGWVMCNRKKSRQGDNLRMTR